MNRESQSIFEDMPVMQAILKLAVPTVIGQLVVLIYNLADTFYIGRADNPWMVGAASLILPFYNIAIALAGIAGVGGGTLITRLLGSGDEKAAKRVSAFSIAISLFFAAFFALTTALFMTPLLYALGASPETFSYARQYAFFVIVLGGVPTVLSLTLSNLFRSVGFAREAGIGVSMGGILNILLDPVFMFCFFPKGMETMAVGAATMTSNVVVCIYYLILLYRRRDETVLLLPGKEKLPDKKHIKDILSVGIPAAAATLLFDLDFIVIDRLMAGFGDIPLAAVGIVLKAERLPLNVGIGLCQGMVPFASYNYASGNYKRMKESVHFSRLAGLVIAAGSVILYEIFAPSVIRFFIREAGTVRLGASFLRIRCLATPFMFLCFHMVHFFQAVGEGKDAMILAVIRWAVFNIPMLFLFRWLFGMYGIVWTQLTADIFTVMVTYYVYDRFQKRMKI